MSVMPARIERLEVPEQVPAGERLTWCRLRWPLGAGSASRVRDVVSEHDSIAIPLIGVASWIVENWWSLLYELSPVEDDGRIAPGWLELDQRTPGWRTRHSMRVADASLLLPDLRVFSNGPGVTWQLRADRGPWPGTTPALQYLDDVLTSGPRPDAVSALGSLIQWTLEQLRGSNLPEANELYERWEYISRTASRSAEAEFCRAAGRLGLDPHDMDDWPQQLCAWMESAPAGQLDQAFSIDLMSFAGDAADLPEIDGALRQLVVEQDLRAAPANVARGCGAGERAGIAAYLVGYERAEQLRRDAGFSPGDYVDLAELLFRARGLTLRTLSAPLPGSPIGAVAGWSGEVAKVLAPRRRGRRPSERFALARGLYHALWTCAEGPRLVSDAHDADQKASRAFAAEVLTPRAAVRMQVDERRMRMPVADAVAEVAGVYGVDDVVVERQYENAVAGR